MVIVTEYASKLHPQLEPPPPPMLSAANLQNQSLWRERPDSSLRPMFRSAAVFCRALPRFLKTLTRHQTQSILFFQRSFAL